MREPSADRSERGEREADGVRRRLGADGGTVALDHDAVDTHAQRGGHGDVNGAHGLTVGRAGPGDAGRRDAHVGCGIPRSEGRAHSLGHLPRNAGVDRPVGTEQRPVDAEESLLELGRIGHDPAADDGGRAGHGDEIGHDEAAGERFGDRDGPLELAETVDEAFGVRAATRRHERRFHLIRQFVHVLARGRLTLYEARGEYQLVLDHMEEAGEGALRRAFEELKAKLAAEGLFDGERKRPLPHFARRIGVITSPGGAAVRDVLSVLARRFPLVEADVLPVSFYFKPADQ